MIGHQISNACVFKYLAVPLLNYFDWTTINVNLCLLAQQSTLIRKMMLHRDFSIVKKVEVYARGDGVALFEKYITPYCEFYDYTHVFDAKKGGRFLGRFLPSR